MLEEQVDITLKHPVIPYKQKRWNFIQGNRLPSEVDSSEGRP